MEEVLHAVQSEFHRYRKLGDATIAQLNSAQCNFQPAEGANSITVLVAHISGNLKSRFTDFLSSDGEKEWRQRDSEFEDRELDGKELLELWNSGWMVLEQTLQSLSAEDLTKTVQIRQQELGVVDALERSLAHIAFHVGQIVLLARLQLGAKWKSLSIPRGESSQYNQNPDREGG